MFDGKRTRNNETKKLNKKTVAYNKIQSTTYNTYKW